ncbi:hypothetical protein ABID82_004238 [Methylobacterium sp. PvP062]|jgi:hypothetical protein|uniref:Uncharacterized protein n=1 Tax=Methylobacterium radiotolerans TaxID=31998 RepID=A0ABV2NL89_9HYPH|nr:MULTISPECIES: hypothetical protein [unclassified Methylobacterium]KZC01402.1 hypothetical protein AU375_02326 [Methylobacterium radiotolerans]MBP2496000.1 hypothetical protein [Methylobacterium sp. PvP105]MBP2504129.1 hypothetical protein [Methylobacterium sp. PvP109]MCX7333083.1 hypothetical protein [Hyphomicrobiales bacterium]
MPAVFRAASANLKKLLSGQALFQPQGQNAARNLGDCEFQRNVKTEHVDLTSNEVPEKPILARVTTSVNEDFKLTCMSFGPVVQALSYMAPVGETYTQAAVNAGVVNIPATAKSGDIFDCVDPNTGAKVYGVIFTNVDYSHYNYDPLSGRVEVLVSPGAADQVDFTAPAVTADMGRAFFRVLQFREIRGKLIIRENNLWGPNQDHVYPLVSFRMNGSQNLIDNGKEPTKVEIDGLIEFDVTQPVGKERGYVVDLPTA